MCGLIAAIDNRKNKKPVNPLIVDMYEEQYKRGEEGFGIIALDKTNQINLMRATEPAKFMFDLHNKASSIMFAHHRTPTSTKNKISQTHPILVDHNILKYIYYVMHNGMIRNCDELKEEHEKMGFEYTTELEGGSTTVCGTYGTMYKTCSSKYNDSEALAIEMALYIENLQKEVHFEGSAAFLIVKVDRKTQKAVEFIYGRHINPLNLQKDKGILTLASEGPGEAIEEDIVFSMNLDSTMKTKSRTLEFVEKTTAIPSPSEYAGFGIPKTVVITPKKEEAVAMTSVVVMTEEDEKDVEEYDPGYSLNADTFDNAMEYALGDINSMMEDFLDELSEEGTAYTVSIEEYLKRMKASMKKTKGQVINFYRNLEEDTGLTADDLDEINNGYKPKDYNSGVDEYDVDLGPRQRAFPLRE